MKLRDYVGTLNALLESCPDSGDLEVIYSRDDEGNGYQRVYWTGSLGHFNDNDDAWYPDEHLNEEDMGDDEFDPKEYPINSVCIN